MPDIKQAFPSKYLKASDLGDSEPIVTIHRVDFEAVGCNREMKGVVYFKGKEKGVVLNKTNANKITSICGSSLTEDWEGHQIKLYSTETEFGGETVDCIRVKSATAVKKPVAPLPRPEPIEPDSDIPFAWLLPLILASSMGVHSLLV